MDWHNQMRKLKTKTGKPLSPTYLKTIHGQLSTIFNHAVKYYDLSTNPARKAGAPGEEEGKEMLFWTKEEYKRFAEEMMDKPLSYYAFQLLYWCGIRSGELLALTPADFNFKKKTLRINKSYQRLKGEDVISTPKTKNSVRTVIMPQLLCDEMQDCLKLYYNLKSDDLIFPVTKYYLNHEMERGCKASGVKKIRVHDLRHPYVKHTTKIFSLRLMDFQAQAYPDARRKTRGACQLYLYTITFGNILVSDALNPPNFINGHSANVVHPKSAELCFRQLVSDLRNHRGSHSAPLRFLVLALHNHINGRNGKCGFGQIINGRIVFPLYHILIVLGVVVSI